MGGLWEVGSFVVSNFAFYRFVFCLHFLQCTHLLALMASWPCPPPFSYSPPPPRPNDSGDAAGCEPHAGTPGSRWWLGCGHLNKRRPNQSLSPGSWKWNSAVSLQVAGAQAVGAGERVAARGGWERGESRVF